MKKGDFTLPGEAGYEALTLELANKWGADVIRDSDGTVLSDEIINADYDIYSTICIIRDHNEWLKQHPDQYQQCFLMSDPVMATSTIVTVHLMNGYFAEQFRLNSEEDSIKYWEVYDRTANEKIGRDKWIYDRESGNVTIQNIEPYHYYTVNFMVYRIWEEISMYNHITNNWDKEHLAPVDPRSEIAKEYLTEWLVKWCEEHPNTNVVRFTSMFYNFVWIWGDKENNQNRFSDWGSYDFTVSPKALDDFEKEYGYAITSEDFINKGKLHVTHANPNKRLRDYMEFTQKFVSTFGRKLVDIVHSYGKKAYVFYDDSWIGVEPYGKYFEDFNFDGLIKCVFSGYELRLCAGAKAPVHELRLHPYLFPVGLAGVPTFSEGGNPTQDAKNYWVSVRRALLRQSIDRLGLGGYLHLTEGFPDFVDYIEKLLDEFRDIKALHKDSEVYTLPIKVAVLHSWGKLRSWTLSGHFHETYMHVLIHINEMLSGLPIDVEFIDFEEVKEKNLKDVDVIINAGKAGSAWSGSDNWNDAKVIAKLNEWVSKGGVFMGVGEPSACYGNEFFFSMATVLGVDKDLGERVCHGKPSFEVDYDMAETMTTTKLDIKKQEGIYLVSDDAIVLDADDNTPKFVINPFGKGYGVYLSDIENSYDNARLLLNILMKCKNIDATKCYLAKDVNVDCAYFEKSRKLVVVNNADTDLTTVIGTPEGEIAVSLSGYEMKILAI